MEADSKESNEQKTEEQIDYKEKYLRSLADLANQKKRLQKDKENFQKYANEKVLMDLLTSIDNFERLFDTESEKLEEKTKEGIELVYNDLLKVLEKHNVKKVQTETFDPEIHQVVSKAESDGESGKIVEIFRDGYHIDDKLMRPALVSVS